MHETQLLRDEDDIEEAKMVFKCMGYARLAKLETGLGELVEFESRAKDFASLFELEVAHVQCSLRVVEESYKSATSLLDHHS